MASALESLVVFREREHGGAKPCNRSEDTMRGGHEGLCKSWKLDVKRDLRTVHRRGGIWVGRTLKDMYNFSDLDFEINIWG